MEINYNFILEKATSLVQAYGMKILYAILTVIIGWYIINFFMMLFQKLLEKRKIDISIAHFLSAIVGVILKILLLITTLSIMGIPTTSFIAALAAMGFAIGLALQGSLSNFAGGVLILVFKPFKIGHYIEAQGVSGTVKKIDIINTIINTPDNKRIIIPNGPLSNDVIVNFSAEKTRRVDMIFSIGYGDDIELAKGIIEKAIKADKRILQDKENLIAVGMLNASSVDIKTRVWANKSDYWNIYHEFQENIKNKFDEAGISIPFPQQDVHIYKH